MAASVAVLVAAAEARLPGWRCLCSFQPGTTCRALLIGSQLSLCCQYLVLQCPTTHCSFCPSVLQVCWQLAPAWHQWWAAPPREHRLRAGHLTTAAVPVRATGGAEKWRGEGRERTMCMTQVANCSSADVQHSRVPCSLRCVAIRLVCQRLLRLPISFYRLHPTICLELISR